MNIATFNRKVHNKLNNFYNRDKLIYLIDEVLRIDDEIQVRGWACVHLANGEYTEALLEVEDGKGSLVEFSVEHINRSDVNQKICGGGYVDNGFGFCIKFAARKYTKEILETYLLISYKKNVQKIIIDTVKVVEEFRKYKSLEDMKRLADEQQIEDDQYYKRVRGNRFYKEIIKKRLIARRDIPYMAWRRYQQIDDDERSFQKKYDFEYKPCISILVPAYRTPRDFLIQMIESVMNQTYSNWQLCIADASLDDSIVDILEEYHTKDPRVVYKLLDENLGISDNTNAALDIATGDFIALLDHDDLLDEDALYEVVRCINEEKVDVVYTDEDKVNMTLDYYFDPHYKPDYNRELLMSCNYITHFFVVKKDIVDRVGLLDKRFDGSQDFEFILRCTSQVKKVGHVDKVVYHWRCHPQSTAMNPETKMYCYTAGVDAIQKTLEDSGVDGEAYRQDAFGCYGVRYKLQGTPKVLTFVINGKNYKSDYENEEVLYIECATLKEIYDKITKMLKEHKSDYIFIVQGSGKVSCLSDLLANVQRKEVGIAGAKVVSSDGVVIEAGRVVSRDAGKQNVCEGMQQDDLKYDMRLILQQEVMAYGLNGVMISFDDVEKYLSQRKVNCETCGTMNQYVIGEGKKIVYVPVAEYGNDEKYSRIKGNIIDVNDIVREDVYYNKNYSKDEKPYTFSW